MLWTLFLLIHIFRLKEAGFSFLERFALALDGAEEAGLVALVTGGTVLIDLDEEAIAIAIEGDVFHGLGVAAFLAFHPEFLTGAAPKVGLAGGDGALQGGTVHPSHHDDAAAFLFLHDGGNEAVGIKFKLVVKTHNGYLSRKRGGEPR
jgi:hypothetical protein